MWVPVRGDILLLKQKHSRKGTHHLQGRRGSGQLASRIMDFYTISL
jgi:hypothetical protein